MSRLQYCRKHIDDVAEACDLSKSTVLEVKQASTFCDDNSEFSELPTSAILTLIRVQDPLVKERAISLAQKALTLQTPTGGKKNKSFTAKDIKKIIDIACTEIRMGTKTEPPKEVIPDTNEHNGSHISHTTEESAVVQTTLPNVSNRITTIVTKVEINLYFEIMEKVGCGKEIPKHKKCIETRVANKTLVIVDTS